MTRVAVMCSVAFGVACATVIASPITYELVPVGNPSNINDASGYGGVPYVYSVGKYEVTLGQYTAFLNAVAASDPNGLYHEYMPLSLNTAGIQRSGTEGSFAYAVVGPAGTAYGQSAAARPAGHISWFDAARFANWMANGQPIGPQNATTTENGAYDLSQSTPTSAPARNAINPNTGLLPAYFIPTENEWYKAAYYSPTLNQGAGGYYDFATQSDVAPGNVVGNAPNQANYMTSVYSLTQASSLNFNQNYLTDVGAYSGSPSFYGTFDQTGNVIEWNDLLGQSGNRGNRGGEYGTTAAEAGSLAGFSGDPSTQWSGSGFRLVVSPVPEPSTVALNVVGLACVAWVTLRCRSSHRA